MWMLSNSMFVLSCMRIICTWLNNWGCLRTLWRQYLFIWVSFAYLEIAVDNISKKKIIVIDCKIIDQICNCRWTGDIPVNVMFGRWAYYCVSLIELIKFASGFILTLCWLGWHNGQINPWLSGLTLFNPLSIWECMDIDVIAVPLIELRFFPGLHINSVLIGLTWWPD